MNGGSVLLAGEPASCFQAVFRRTLSLLLQGGRDSDCTWSLRESHAVTLSWSTGVELEHRLVPLLAADLAVLWPGPESESVLMGVPAFFSV